MKSYFCDINNLKTYYNEKILVLFVLSIACIMGTHAQEGLKWGAMAGMNSSKFSTDGLDSKVGFHVGIKAEKNYLR